MGLLTDTMDSGFVRQKKFNKFVYGDRDGSELATRPIDSQPIKPEVAAKPIVYDGAKPIEQEDLTNMTTLDIMRKYGKRESYENEIKEAERQKKLGMVSDILGMASDIGTAAAGRRIYGDRISQTEKPDERLQKLKDLQKEANIRYDNALLQARLADRDEAIRQQATAAATARAQANKNRELALKEADLTRKARKDAGDLANDAAKNEAQKRYWSGRLANDSRKTQAYVDKHSGSGKEKFDYIYGKDGRETRVPKDKTPGLANAVVGKLKDMYNSTEDATTKLELDVAMDMIKTDRSSAITVMQRLVYKHPELQDWIESVLGHELPKEKTQAEGNAYEFLKKNNLLSGSEEKYEGLMRPQWQIDADKQAANKKKGGKSLWGDTTKINQNKKIGW